MEIKLTGEITIQELLCWVALFLIAWNPAGFVSGMIEEVGYKSPLIALATGAGFNYFRSKLKGDKQ